MKSFLINWFSFVRKGRKEKKENRSGKKSDFCKKIKFGYEYIVIIIGMHPILNPISNYNTHPVQSPFGHG